MAGAGRSRQAEPDREARAAGRQVRSRRRRVRPRHPLPRHLREPRGAARGALSVAIALARAGSAAWPASPAAGSTLLIMRVVDVLLAFPYLLLAIAVVSALGPSVLNTTIAVGIWGSPRHPARPRAVLVARESEYVRAARALGASAGRVLTRHVLRNILPPCSCTRRSSWPTRSLSRPRCRSSGSAPSRRRRRGAHGLDGRDFLCGPHLASVPGLAIGRRAGVQPARGRASRRAGPAAQGPTLMMRLEGGLPS